MGSLDNGKRARDPSIALDEYKVNIDLWRHFDGLRQQKNSAFLTAQGFLIAAVAIAFQVHGSSHLSSRLISGTAQQIAVGVSVFGLVLSLAWLALQVRNGKYIKFHRNWSGPFDHGVILPVLG